MSESGLEAQGQNSVPPEAGTLQPGGAGDVQPGAQQAAPGQVAGPSGTGGAGKSCCCIVSSFFSSQEECLFWRNFILVMVFGAIGGLISFLQTDWSNPKSADGLPENCLAFMLFGVGAGLAGVLLVGNKDLSEMGDPGKRQKLAHALALALVSGIAWKAVYSASAPGSTKDEDLTNKVGETAQATEEVATRAASVAEKAGKGLPVPVQDILPEKLGLEMIRPTQVAAIEASAASRSPEVEKQLKSSIDSTVKAFTAALGASSVASASGQADVALQDAAVETARRVDSIALEIQQKAATTGDITTNKVVAGALNAIPTRVYVQIFDESRRAVANSLRNELSADVATDTGKPWCVVPGVENVCAAGGKANAVSATEVRYFHDEDLDRARRALAAVKKLDPEVVLSFNSAFAGTTRVGTLEVWFKGACGVEKAVSSPAPQEPAAPAKPAAE